MSTSLQGTGTNRWGQLIMGVICMVLIANLQGNGLDPVRPSDGGGQ